ncbi:BC1872 family protein [Sporolactobacillus terrae]|uniref:BC1872 family protein n=1 Tax=Sporolactobacillus terrae TaxID=269673 RepID=UPI00048DC1BE|nr:hypothetical protein [Sporolactobacillus terrae]
MTNLEIDCKLAEAMGYEVYEFGLPDVKVYKDPPETWKRPCEDWYPTINMQDAWEVAKHFGFRYLRKNSLTRQFEAFLDCGSTYEKARTAPMAICKAALKVIEGQERSKSDE